MSEHKNYTDQPNPPDLADVLELDGYNFSQHDPVWDGELKVKEKADSDPAKIENTANELKVLMARLVDLRIGKILEVKTILTPEQFGKFKQKVS